MDLQCVKDSPIFGLRSAGVLKYHRESEDKINFTTIPPESQQQIVYPVKCDYCGKNAEPSLDQRWAQGSEIVPPFCCQSWLHLWETLEKMRCLAERRILPRIVGTSVKDVESSEERDEPSLKGREMKDYYKLTMDVESSSQQSKARIEEYKIYQPEAKLFPSSSKVFRYQYSLDSEKRYRTVAPDKSTERFMNEEDKQVLLHVCNHKTSQFGLCGHQDRTEVLQKCYSNGLKFLTVLPDGAAHVFYPSGVLALIIVVTEQNGRVCIVYDDSTSLHQPMRALFHSDGRATCYHSNGNTWLTLNRKGGVCLNEKGAKVCGWSWGSLSLISAPLKPVFLSLNKAVGVRVMGQEKVFVSFLLGGQQAKFSVGSCCVQAKCDANIASPAPSILKEELFVLAARMKMHLPIQHLHPDLTTTSSPQLKALQASHRHAVAQKILEVSADVMMSQSEKDFIHWCLEGCLGILKFQ